MFERIKRHPKFSAAIGAAVIAAGTAGGLLGTQTVCAGPCGPPKPEPQHWPVVSDVDRTGTPQVGDHLSTTNGTWVTSGDLTGYPNLSYAYQWQRCDSNGSNCADISSATSSTYQLVSADQDHVVRVIVTATNAGGDKGQNSLYTASIAAGGGGGLACTQTINSSANLQTTLAGASGGAVICLSSGTYSTGLTISGVNPTSTVTVQPAPGATVTLNSVNINASSSHLTFTQFVSPSDIRGWNISGNGGSTHDITFSYDYDNGNCPNGPASCGGTGLITTYNLPANSNVVMSHDWIVGVSDSNGSYEGSIELINTNACQSPGDGVTIDHLLFDAGISDGIQFAGSECGTHITHSMFVNKIEPSGSACVGYENNSCPHVDSIQTVNDGTGITITGNYFNNQIDCELGADGTDVNQTFSNNVCVDSGYRQITVSAWTGGTVEHNTFAPASQTSVWDCNHAAQCTSGVTARNNIFLGGVSNGVQTAGGQFSTFDHNMGGCPPATNPCTNAIGGTPTFTGGATPTSWIGYRLTGPTGHNAGSDGTDVGNNDWTTTPGP